MSAYERVLRRMRKICLSLPDTEETETWGKPHFRVKDKIFSGCSEEDGRPTIGFKLEKRHAAERVEDPRFWPSPYVGKHGWVTMDASGVSGEEWDDVADMVLESYELIAPKRSLAKLEGGTPEKKKAPNRRTRGT